MLLLETEWWDITGGINCKPFTSDTFSQTGGTGVWLRTEEEKSDYFPFIIKSGSYKWKSLCCCSFRNCNNLSIRPQIGGEKVSSLSR